MTATTLAGLLDQKPVLLADGATGTNFFDLGLGPGDPPEFWNLDAPEKVTALHQAFVDAGSDIILTNTFGSNAPRLKLHKAQDRVFEYNEAGARLARAVADETDRPVVVAGSVGPTGELFEPLGEMTYDDAVKAFVDQMLGLKAGGADVAWIETMSAKEEMQAAADAANICDLPYVVTASFDTAGMTMMGLPPSEMPHLLDSMETRPVAVGANCGVGASDLLMSVLSMSEQPGDMVIVAKANCGIPQVRGDQVEYTGTPDLMADYIRLAVDAGARIIGGCCGTSPLHLAAMRQALDAHHKGDRPDEAMIVETIGPIINPVSTGAGKTERRPRRRGR
uniref:betaine--homocysteine S-methyltransferase n=1 Tax=Pararhizobium sp. IMCC3301 TaxID=3067904 RepID=UPI002741CAD8|nr:betaine--homocysteine S-methyltransferase [Pararhizobium sp. IMCC3301]